MHRIIVFIAAVLISGCASALVQPLTPEARAVRVTGNPEATRGCTFLGNVEQVNVGSSDNLVNAIDDRDASNKLLNSAAKLGANVLFIPPRTGRSFLRGEAYRCPPPAP